MLKPRYILITTPSMSVLKERLASRHIHKDVNERLEKAKSGQYQENDYDCTIVNGDLEKAYRQLKEFCISKYWADFEQEDG